MVEFRVSYIFYYIYTQYSEIFNDECDAMVDMTWNDLYAKVKVIHFGTNQFLIYNFIHPVNSNFCCRTQRLATIYTLQTTYMPEHVYLTPIPDNTSDSIAFSSTNIPSHVVVYTYPLLHSFYSVSLSSQKFLRSANTLWARRHGRMAARQKSPPETAAKAKFLTVIMSNKLLLFSVVGACNLVARITYTVLVETLNHAQLKRACNLQCY